MEQKSKSFFSIWFSIILHNLRKKNNEKLNFTLKTFIEAVAVLAFIGYIGISLMKLTNYLVNIDRHEYLHHFKYISINETLKNRIDSVDEYIFTKKQEGKKVYILDSSAAVYIIPTNDYNKDYDMFNLGNFGTKGEKRNNTRLRNKRICKRGL